MGKARELLKIVEGLTSKALGKVADIIVQALSDEFSISPSSVDRDEDKGVVGFKFDSGYSKIASKVSSNGMLILPTKMGKVKLRVVRTRGDGMVIYYYANEN